MKNKKKRLFAKDLRFFFQPLSSRHRDKYVLFFFFCQRSAHSGTNFLRRIFFLKAIDYCHYYFFNTSALFKFISDLRDGISRASEAFGRKNCSSCYYSRLSLESVSQDEIGMRSIPEM